jgi:hypothetical protein
VFPVSYELGSYIPGDGILHSHRRENLKSFKAVSCLITKQKLTATRGKSDPIPTIGTHPHSPVVLRLVF